MRLQSPSDEGVVDDHDNDDDQDDDNEGSLALDMSPKSAAVARKMAQQLQEFSMSASTESAENVPAVEKTQKMSVDSQVSFDYDDH